MTHPPAALLATPSLWRRMAAWWYEAVLLFGVVFVAGYLVGTLGQSRHAMQHRSVLQLVLFVVVGLYFIWCWCKGQTLAMKTWGIRITDADGRPVSWQRALLRYLSSWIWWAPLLLVAVVPLTLSWRYALAIQAIWIAAWALLTRCHPARQFWHDSWCGTRLVCQTRPPSRPEASPDPAS